MTNALVRMSISELSNCWNSGPHGPTPDWAAIRDFSDGVLANPERAMDALSERPRPSGEPFFDAFLASLAETLAERTASRAPLWTSGVAALAQPWCAPGTPRMVARWRQHTPPAFAKRNLVVDIESLWHVRAHGV
ncbi:MAG TPA: hypothetical protein DDY88_02735 [Actinobacteria bacterium]|nr:hypothetical protein [Actinomycetota bacterium]